MTTTIVTPNLLRDWPLPKADGGKYSRGQVVVVGGAAKTPGAAMLAGLAALRVGAGRLTLAVAASVASQVAVAVPEAGVQPLDEVDGHVAPGALDGMRDDLAGADAVLIGPGLDEPTGTKGLLRALAANVGPHTTVLLDAFALGVAADVADALRPFAGRLVLSPNDAEAARLLDTGTDTGDNTDTDTADTGTDTADTDTADNTDTADTDTAAIARALAERYSAVVSFRSVVAAPDGSLWATGTGTGGLGTSGSGDVLSGTIAGIAARGADPVQAAVWATHAHAAAGDRLAVEVGPTGYLARELLAELPRVLVEHGG